MGYFYVVQIGDFASPELAFSPIGGASRPFSESKHTGNLNA